MRDPIINLFSILIIGLLLCFSAFAQDIGIEAEDAMEEMSAAEETARGMEEQAEYAKEQRQAEEAKANKIRAKADQAKLDAMERVEEMQEKINAEKDLKARLKQQIKDDKADIQHTAITVEAKEEELRRATIEVETAKEEAQRLTKILEEHNRELSVIEKQLNVTQEENNKLQFKFSLISKKEKKAQEQLKDYRTKASKETAALKIKSELYKQKTKQSRDNYQSYKEEYALLKQELKNVRGFARDNRLETKRELIKKRNAQKKISSLNRRIASESRKAGAYRVSIKRDCNLRSIASASGALIETAKKGRKMTVFKHDKKWLKTRIGSGKEAYISKRCFK